jgi:hypothetical protein
MRYRQLLVVSVVILIVIPTASLGKASVSTGDPPNAKQSVDTDLRATEDTSHQRPHRDAKPRQNTSGPSTSVSNRSVDAQAAASDGSWQTMSTGKFLIEYKPDVRSDAENLSEWMPEIRSTIQSTLPDSVDTETTLEDPIHVRVHPVDEYDDSPCTVSWNSYPVVRINVPALSESRSRIKERCIQPSGESVGEWYEKALAHEYLNIVLWDYGTGGTSYDYYGRNPSWFPEGITEYYVYRSTGYDRPIDIDRLNETIREGKGYFDPIAADRYNGGHLLAMYLFDKYDPAAVWSILKDDADTFATALNRSLDVSYPEFKRRWVAWADENIGGPYPFDVASAEELHSIAINQSQTIDRQRNTIERLQQNRSAMGRVNVTVTPVSQSADVSRRPAASATGPSPTFDEANRPTGDATGRNEFETSATSRVRSDVQAAQGQWKTLSTDEVVVEYRDGYESDARQVKRWFDRIRLEVTQITPDGTEPSLGSRIHIRAYPGSEWSRSDYSLYWESTDPVYINLQAPSDSPNGEDWHEHGLAHEYLNIVLWDYGTDGTSYYYYGRNPPWFGEGVSEYYAYRLPSVSDQYPPPQTEQMNQSIKSGSGYFNEVSSDRYHGGHLIAQYMFDEYGEAAVWEIPKDDADTFATALNRSLDVSYLEFKRNWLSWADEHIGGDYRFEVASRADLASLADEQQKKIENQQATIERLRNRTTRNTVLNVSVRAENKAFASNESVRIVASSTIANVAALSVRYKNTTESLGSDREAILNTAGTGQQQIRLVLGDATAKANITVEQQENSINVTRTVSATEVPQNEEVTVTTIITGVSGAVSTTSSYDPQVASATVQSVTVNGASTNPIIATTERGSVVTLGDVDVGTGTDATVRITEELTVGEETDVTHSITGNVTAGETTTEVDPVTVTVAEPQSVVDEYDTDNDGTISITELGVAGADFARGELTITELGRIGAEFAS